MTVSHWQSNQPPQRETDLLIIGAGLAGCAAALLAKEEGLHVTVVEKADVALGASGRNAGFMISGLDTYYHHAVEKYGAEVTREMWALSKETLAFWRAVVARAEGRVPMWNCGSMLLAESEAEAEDLAKAHRALQENGITTEFFPYDPLKRGYYAAIRQPEDGAVHPVLLAQEMLSQSGADFVPNNELYALEQRADSVTAHTRLYTFRAKYVLLCTNAYSALVDDYFVGKVIPTRAQVLVTEPLPAPVLETCGYSDYGYMYYRMTFDGRLLLGGARHHYKALEHDTTEDKLNALVQAKLDDYLQAHFPDVSAPVARRWAGIMGFSVDGLPLVGTLPNRPRIGFAVGFTGHGLAMAAGTIKRALARLLHGTHAGAVDSDRLALIS
jgi:gamma-glutamylputrescine oxidase